MRAQIRFLSAMMLRNLVALAAVSLSAGSVAAQDALEFEDSPQRDEGGLVIGSAEEPSRLSQDDIEAILSPHGRWIEDNVHGWVWVPRGMAPTWVPYTRGHWVAQGDDWLWVSDLPWGEVAFHYGRWARRPRVGWVWVPGLTYAPSWTVFRRAPGWVGWAPLPPGAGFRRGRYEGPIDVGYWCYGRWAPGYGSVRPATVRPARNLRFSPVPNPPSRRRGHRGRWVVRAPIDPRQRRVQGLPPGSRRTGVIRVGKSGPYHGRSYAHPGAKPHPERRKAVRRYRRSGPDRRWSGGRSVRGRGHPGYRKSTGSRSSRGRGSVRRGR